jgi:putative transposase
LWSVLLREPTMAFTRRHLPHWIPDDADVFVTWRLAGSIPLHLSQTNRKPRPSQSDPAWLQDPRVARMVVNALLYGETVRRFYQLHAWVIMPNHVHAIVRPHAPMSTIMRWLKGRTGRMANRILGRTGGAFWQDESFDHWIRSAEELQYLMEYVENNPSKAGLIDSKERWQWSSAYRLTDDEKRSSVLPVG